MNELYQCTENIFIRIHSDSLSHEIFIKHGCYCANKHAPLVLICITHKEVNRMKSSYQKLSHINFLVKSSRRNGLHCSQLTGSQVKIRGACFTPHAERIINRGVQNLPDITLNGRFRVISGWAPCRLFWRLPTWLVKCGKWCGRSRELPMPRRGGHAVKSGAVVNK